MMTSCYMSPPSKKTLNSAMSFLTVRFLISFSTWMTSVLDAAENSSSSLPNNLRLLFSPYSFSSSFSITPLLILLPFLLFFLSLLLQFIFTLSSLISLPLSIAFFLCHLPLNLSCWILHNLFRVSTRQDSVILWFGIMNLTIGFTKLHKITYFHMKLQNIKRPTFSSNTWTGH